VYLSAVQLADWDAIAEDSRVSGPRIPRDRAEAIRVIQHLTDKVMIRVAFSTDESMRHAVSDLRDYAIVAINANLGLRQVPLADWARGQKPRRR